MARLPDGWSEKPLKRVARINSDKLLETTDPDYEIEYVDIGNVTLETGIERTERFRFEDSPSRARRQVKDGDTIVSTVRTYLKAVARIADAPANLVVSTGFAVLRAGPDLDPRFLYRVAQSQQFVERIVAHSVGVSYPAINPNDFGRFPIPIPPLDEQRAIARFLDRETGKIDELIVKKERLLELLKEKRQIVISHAVTKGLNPYVPMKSSDIEWLGDVPEHWKVMRLKRLVSNLRRITYGIVQPGESDANGRFMIRGKDYSSGWCQPDEIFRVSSAIEVPYARSRIQTGDLVMTIVGAGVGNVALIPDWLDGANITQTTARIALDLEKAQPEFVRYALQGLIGQRNLERNVYGSAQPRLNIEHVDSYLMTVPPLDEQRRIVACLKGELDQFAELVAEAQRGIDLLQECRAALISAAVTGQIDVRDAVTEPDEAMAALEDSNGRPH